MFGKKFLNLNTISCCFVFFFFCRGLGNQSNVVSLVRHIGRHMMSVHVLLTNVNFDLLLEMISSIDDFIL